MNIRSHNRERKERIPPPPSTHNYWKIRRHRSFVSVLARLKFFAHFPWTSHLQCILHYTSTVLATQRRSTIIIYDIITRVY